MTKEKKQLNYDTQSMRDKWHMGVRHMTGANRWRVWVRLSACVTNGILLAFFGDTDIIYFTLVATVCISEFS